MAGAYGAVTEAQPVSTPRRLKAGWTNRPRWPCSMRQTLGRRRAAYSARPPSSWGKTHHRLARTAERVADLEGELPNAFAVPCDVADPMALATALEASSSAPASQRW